MLATQSCCLNFLGMAVACLVKRSMQPPDEEGGARAADLEEEALVRN